MTRRDFRDLEEILKEVKQLLPFPLSEMVIDLFARELKKRYPRFDAKKFTYTVNS